MGISLVAQMVKNLSAMKDTLGSIPGLGRSPGEENGSPLQYSCLENSMDRGPGGLQSMESHSIRHNWAHTHTKCRKSDLAYRVFIFIHL